MDSSDSYHHNLDLQKDLIGSVILIVDDSDIYASQIKTLLEQFDVNIETCQDSTAAVSKVLNQRPSLIFINSQMPKIDGIQLCKILKSHEDSKYIPTVLIMPAKDQDRALFAINSGADSFLINENLPSLLLPTVSMMMRLSKNYQEHTQLKKYKDMHKMMIDSDVELNSAKAILNSYIKLVEKSKVSKNKDKIIKLKQTSEKITNLLNKLAGIKSNNE